MKPGICFVAPNAYGVLSGRADLRQIGGAEVQQAWIARELVRRGYRVSFVTWDHGQADGIDLDGIRVFHMCRRDAGLAGLRFLHPRWTSLAAAMRRADANVYYQRTGGVETGQVAMWCRLHRRRMIAAIANDRDCEPTMKGQANWRERKLYAYGLTRADAVVAQTETQRHLLATHFGVEARVIRSCTNDPANETISRGIEPRILWIGRFSRQKRIDRLLDIARRCPNLSFDVVGDSARPDAAAREAVEQLAHLSNVKLHGFVGRDETNRFYRDAAVLACTSDYEGFPNTFLEAWAHGIPVVSTLDPDGVIAANRLGGVAASNEEFAAQLEVLANDPMHRRASGARARAHFEQTHTIAAAGDAYERLLQRLGDSLSPTEARSAKGAYARHPVIP